MGGNEANPQLVGDSAELGFGGWFPRRLFLNRPVFLLLGVYKENPGFAGVSFQRNSVEGKGPPQEFHVSGQALVFAQVQGYYPPGRVVNKAVKRPPFQTLCMRPLSFSRLAAS
jgi:hypothetical protein